MTFDDETLMAYADGELDETQRAAIALALQKDPQLARRVEQHRALRAGVAGAYAPVIDQPIPERLLSAARGAEPASSASRASRGGEVLPFPGPAARPVARQWGVPQWAAMAGSLVLGIFLSWKFFAASDAHMVASNGTLVARGALASALDSQRASTQSEADAILVGISFRTPDAGYCRSFTIRAAATGGLACLVDEQWTIAVTASTPASGDVRQAASPPPAVLQAIEARIAGEPLDAAAEDAALRAGWKP